MSNIISAALEEQEEREEAAREAARQENWPMIDAPRLFAPRGRPFSFFATYGTP